MSNQRTEVIMKQQLAANCAVTFDTKINKTVLIINVGLLECIPVPALRKLLHCESALIRYV